MLSRLITAETGNYDRASLKIPSLTVSLGKQLELISPADLIYNHTFSWRQETLTLLHLSEDENLVHFVSLSFNFTPVDITYPSLTTKLWIHLYFHTVLVLSTKRKKKEILIIVHEKFLLDISSWHSTLCRIPLNSRTRARLLKREDDPLSPTPSRSPSRSGVGEII